MNLDHHISEDILEQYALGRLSDDASAPVEEHLLVCPTCQDALQEADEYIRAIKAAVSSLEREAAGDSRFVRDFRIQQRLSKPQRLAHFAALLLL